MDIRPNLCLLKIKFEEKKGLPVIKENNIIDVRVIITSSVRGIFLVVYLFLLLDYDRPITFTERFFSGRPSVF